MTVREFIIYGGTKKVGRCLMSGTYDVEKGKSISMMMSYVHGLSS